MPSQILVVEDDDAIREALGMALAAEHYETSVASSLQEALNLIRDHTYHLILSDLFASQLIGALDSIHTIRELAHPTPVGVVTSWPVASEEADRLGFAFLLHKPFDLDDLFSLIAAAINAPLSAQQNAQAETVYAYFAKLTARDWDGLAALCAEDVVYALPGSTLYAGTVEGRVPFRDHAARTFAHFPDTQFGDIHVYSTPNGLAARYKGTWRQPEGSPASMTGAVIFQFQERLIQRIGIRLDDAHLRSLVGT